MKKLLFVIRLADRDGYNKTTLAVSREENGNALHYSYFGGWQPNGTPHAISNLHMSQPLPITARGWSSAAALARGVQRCLASGYGGNQVMEVVMINTIK